MKKILFIGFDIEGLGGISTYSRYQINALKESFKNIEVYTLDKSKKYYDGYCDITIKYTNKVSLIKLLLKLMSERKSIDLIIFNHINLSFIGAILKKLFAIKYIVFGYNIDLLRNFSIIQNIGYSNLDKLVIDCKFTINSLNKFHKYIPNIELLYDPVDISFFKPSGYTLSRSLIENKYNSKLKNKFVISTIAVMRESEMYKGHFEILDAIHSLQNKNILYCIVGGGNGRYLVEEKVKKLNLESQVKFFGFVENDLIPHFYTASDLVALISKNEYGKGEGVPLGLIEASSCEVPVLAGNEDGSIEAISDKYQNGFRVSPRNIDEIAEKIQYYIDNPEIKKEHGKNGRKFVIQEFEYSKFRDKQAKIIKETFI